MLGNLILKALYNRSLHLNIQRNKYTHAILKQVSQKIAFINPFPFAYET